MICALRRGARVVSTRSMKRPEKKPISGPSLVLGLASGSLTLMAIIVGARLVNIEHTARRQHSETSAVDRAASGARLAAQPLHARDGLREVVAALHEAWRPGRSPSPTVLAALAEATDEAARSDAFTAAGAAVMCVGYAAGREAVVTRDGGLVLRGAAARPTGLADVAACAFAGDVVALVSREGEVALWSVGGPVAQRARWSSGLADPRSVALSRDGALVAVGARTRDVRVFEAGTQRVRREVAPGDGTVERLAFAPDGRALAAVGGDGVVRLWDVTDTAATQGDRTLSLHSAGVTNVAWRADGARLVTAGRDRVAVVWDRATGAVVARCEGARGALHAAALSDDGARVITGGADGVVRVHEADTARCCSRSPARAGAFTR